MKYVFIRGLEDATAALNFESEGRQIIGGCDLYTTKAAGSDKKLYKQIDRELESQQESLLRLVASLSASQAAEFRKTSNLSQSSPFGILSQAGNRRTFAYMIATLNASHPDYDFSNVLRPSDFTRERRLKDVINNIDSKVVGAQSTRFPRGLQTPGGSIMWGPRMWDNIDTEMDLRKCEIYSYTPEENPFDDEETSLWSMHYFFYNKDKKRVCYLYGRALSPTFSEDEESDDNTIVPEDMQNPARPPKRNRQSAEFSAKKRARFWLGDKANYLESDTNESEEEVDVELMDEIFKRGRSMSSNSMSEDLTGDSDEGSRERRKRKVRQTQKLISEAVRA